jgi:hypothetical protein
MKKKWKKKRRERKTIAAFSYLFSAVSQVLGGETFVPFQSFDSRKNNDTLKYWATNGRKKRKPTKTFFWHFFRKLLKGLCSNLNIEKWLEFVHLTYLQSVTLPWAIFVIGNSNNRIKKTLN